MAKFRQNQQRGAKSRGISFIKIILFLGVLAIVLYYLMKLMGQINFDTTDKTDNTVVFDFSKDRTIEDSIRFIPARSTGQIIHHKFYSLSYLEEHEQAEWVAYELTKESLRIPNVPRAKRFNDDPLVETKSATYYDYRGSGYSRGHLAPAADMAFSQEAMQESFFMSNMSPQKSGFNGGIWNELENLTRDWAYKNKSVFVVSGPVLTDEIDHQIGKSKVSVPKLFYKVILDFKLPEKKAIGFILPNETSDRHLKDYAVSVDSVEALTGLDFYRYIMSESEEEEIEAVFDINKWPFDESLFRKRVNQWNKR